MIEQEKNVLSSRSEIGCQGEVFYRESGEALEQVTQRGCGCLISGGIPGQIGQSPGQSDLVLDVVAGSPACFDYP